MKPMTLKTFNQQILAAFGLLLPLCAGLTLTPNLYGQAEAARITGTVTDSTGAVIPNVQVIIIAVGTNRRSELVSNESGRYASGPLQVGEYRVEAQAAGFKRLEVGS